MQAAISLGIKALILKAQNVNKLKTIWYLWYLWKAYKALSCLPEPTLENTSHPNIRNLIQARDWLLENCNLSEDRRTFIRRIINFGIIIYDYDSPWRWIIDSLREKLMEKTWEKRGYDDKRHYTWWGNK